LLRAILTTFIQILNFTALKTMPLVNFYTIIFTAPFVTALLATIFFSEKISWKNWALIFTGFIGVLIAMRPSVEGFGWAETAVLMSATFFAIRNMTVPKMGTQETLLSYGLYTYAGIMIGSFLMLATHGPVHLPPVNTWLMLTTIGAVGAVGIVLTSTAFRIGPTSVAASMHYSQIIWGLLFGFMVFNDIPDYGDLLGAAIVCVCGILIIERRPKNFIPADS
jgi:drug/metabolite transporter (DMT)-like permease